METLAVRGRELGQQRHDRPPRLLAPHLEDVAADLESGPVGGVQPVVRRLVVRRFGRLQHAGIEHADELRQSGHHERAVESRNQAGRGGGIVRDEGLEPLAEPIRVEVLVASGLRGAPEVHLEHGGQLLGRGRLDEGDASFEAGVSNQPLEDVGRQAG